MKRLIYALVLSVSLAGCANNRPPNLSPAGNAAFTQMQVQKALDTIRDIVQDGNATQPPVFSTDTARKVTQWHKIAIVTVHTASQGWQKTLEQSLGDVVVSLPLPERQRIAPYVQLVLQLIQVVQS